MCIVHIQPTIQKKRTWKKQFKNSSKSRFRANRRHGCSHLKHIQMLQMSIECSAYCAPVHIADECHSWLDVEAVKQNKKKTFCSFIFMNELSPASTTFVCLINKTHILFLFAIFNYIWTMAAVVMVINAFLWRLLIVFLFLSFFFSLLIPFVIEMDIG